MNRRALPLKATPKRSRRTWLSTTASTRSHPCGLTSAEITVLTLMAQDLRNADIAARLHRSVGTVDHHVAAVLRKLAVESRLEAVRRAEREGWLASPSGQSAQSGQARDAR